MNEEKIKEVFSDEEFVKSLMELDTPEEVQAALAEKNVEISTDDIKKIAELLQKKAEGELTEEDLENVSGGFIWGAIMAGIFVVQVVAGVAVSVNEATRRRW